MVIRERALVREMKEAYKHGGYTVLVRHTGKTVICSPYWAVEIDDDDVPREALSLMALHMGFLPEPGDAYKIYKGDKTPAVQEEVFEVAAEWVDQLNNAYLIREEKALAVKKTVLTYNGYNVWQEDKTRRILLIHPEYERILYKKEPAHMIGEAVCVADQVSRVYILRAEQIAEDKMLHLAQQEWATVT